MKYRCFHCKEVFDERTATEHFGKSQYGTALCAITREQIDSLERALNLYRNEDTDLHRQIHCMETKHSTELMRAEEEGYAKGLRDGRKLTPERKNDK